MRAPAELTAAFRAHGLKLTPQRQLLFRLLHDNVTHPSAEALFVAASADMPGISLRTVYQTLNDLVAMGELRQIAIGTGPARFDPNVDDHHHVVCTACGDVRDVYVADVDIAGVSGLDGFHVHATEIVFRGRCSECGLALSKIDSPRKEPS
jgi:Fe2+ or Zn2+ uptake regulation protein